MSTCGLYFESKQAHSIGETIRLSMALNDSNVSCEGRVVRAEPLETRFGIAVELTSYDFESELEPARHSAHKQKKSK
jgi:PilZ domain-containing protein